MTVKTKLTTTRRNLTYEDSDGKLIPVVSLIGGNSNLDRAGARVEIVGPTSAFGEVSVSSLVPYAQLKFGNGILAQKMITSVSGSGAVTAADSLLSVSTGATTGSTARLESAEMVRYAPGQGVEVRFTFLFTEGVAGTHQIVGIGTAENALAIGMHGTTLAVLRRTSGQVEIRTLTVTGAPTSDEDLTITLNSGSGVTVPILDADTIGEVARKIADADYSAEGGGWRAVYAGNRVEFLAVTTEARGGTYTFGAGTTGATGAIAQTAASSPAVDNWVDRADWNRDAADGASQLPVLDITKGQVGRIRYQWLGFGMVTFDIENPFTGEFVTIHEIRYANTATAPITLQSDMPLHVETANGGTTDVMVAKSASMGAFALGELVLTGPTFTASESASIDGTESPIFAIRVKEINLQGVTNTIRVFPQFVSLGTDSGKVSTFRGYLNPTLTGAPTWSDIDASESTVEISTDMASFTNGSPVFVHTVGAASGDEHNFGEGRRPTIFRAGDILLVTGVVSSGASSNLIASLVFVEDV